MEEKQQQTVCFLKISQVEIEVQLCYSAPMKHLVLGLAGHIDHGKTSLVQSLTGMNTDRLKEEKERGITTDLGFAHLKLPSGTHMGIIDVPGHERFIKNMVAGASGIDIMLLVVAADDWVMPQTVEHLDICSLLGIKRGIIAITKSDLVDQDTLSLAMEDIRAAVKGSFLDDARIIPVSNRDKSGIDELITCIDNLTLSIQERSGNGFFRMPIDRIFSIKGFGTVATGTAISGSIKPGDEVELLPGNIRSRVRGVEAYDYKVEQGKAGCRLAINLSDISRNEVKRGDVIAIAGTYKASNLIEGKINILPSSPRPLRDGAESILHVGTSAVPVEIFTINSRGIRPGESGFVRIRFREPVCVVYGDRFVIRQTDARTIGGGIILDTNPPRRSRVKASAELSVLASESIPEKIVLYIRRSGRTGTRFAAITSALNGNLDHIRNTIRELIASGRIFSAGETLFPRDTYDELRTEIITELKDYHLKEPLKDGPGLAEIITRLRVSAEILTAVVKRLADENCLIYDGERLRLSSHSIPREDTRNKIEIVFSEAGLSPPGIAELASSMRLKDKDVLGLLNVMVREGKLAKAGDIFFSQHSIDRLVDSVSDFFARKNDMTPSDFKDLAGVSRKYAIPLMEYLDARKITIRVGDVRRLRKG